MDRKTFIQTFGLGVATATFAPNLLFKNEDIILGRYGRNYHNTVTGFELMDTRKSIMNSLNKQLEGTGVHFGRFMKAPASVIFYKDTVIDDWESKHIVAKTMRFRMRLQKDQIREKNGLAIFEDNKLAPMVYEYLAKDIDIGKHCIYSFYDMWVTGIDGKSVGLTDDTVMIWIRFDRTKFDKPMVYADDKQTAQLLNKQRNT